jgi:hypothetical protein
VSSTSFSAALAAAPETSEQILVKTALRQSVIGLLIGAVIGAAFDPPPATVGLVVAGATFTYLAIKYEDLDMATELLLAQSAWLGLNATFGTSLIDAMRQAS